MFSVAAMNAQLKSMGQAVQWRAASVCPCRDIVNGDASADPTCPVCQGRGTFWGNPVAAWTGIAGQRVVREWAKFGMWESGDEVLSIPSDSPLYAIGENDRVLMVDSSEPFSTVLEHTGAETLPFTVVSIETVYWLDPVTRALVSGPIPTVNADGTLTFPIGAAPPVITGTSIAAETSAHAPPMLGTDDGWRGYPDGLPYQGAAPLPVQAEKGRSYVGQYTVTGRKRPEYFCFKELPQDRAHFMGATLPRRVSLRKFDLFGK